MTEVQDHLRLPSLGEDIETTGHNRRDRKIYSIPQVDGIIDSRDSLSLTPDSVDLMVSPEKYRNEYVDRGNKNTDTNDEDTDEILDFNKEKAMRTYGKDKNEKKDSKRNDEDDIHGIIKLTRAKQTKYTR